MRRAATLALAGVLLACALATAPAWAAAARVAPPGPAVGGDAGRGPVEIAVAGSAGDVDVDVGVCPGSGGVGPECEQRDGPADGATSDPESSDPESSDPESSDPESSERDRSEPEPSAGAPEPTDEPTDEEPVIDGDVVASVPFDGKSDDPFEGLRVGDSGYRQWSEDGPNTFEIVEYEGESYGRAQIAGGPHPEDIRAEGIVAGDAPDSTLKFRDGDEYWFGDTIVIGEGFPDRFFNNVLQWKNDGTGSAPLFLGAWDGRLQLRSSFGNEAVGEIDEGVPHRYVIGVGFGSGDGWVEVYRDGEQVLDRTDAATLHGGTESYAKVGYYRGNEIAGTGSVLHRDYRIGTTRESVD